MAADRPDLFQELERVPDLAERILEESQALGEEFGRRRDWHSVLFLGSGPLYGLAQEGALKMIEMGGTPASAYHFLEVRHGPNAIIDSGTLVVGLLSQGGLRYELAVLRSLIQQQEATVIALSPTNDPQPFRAHSFAFGLSDFTQGLAYLPALQLLAYQRAVSRGIDPDRPPHLTPFVRLTPEGG
ncbi:MAG: SIS domain-containing protein [Chloroflexi bacterium]|nr:SIS domain-containing protein [Chloroflexota bacterium]